MYYCLFIRLFGYFINLRVPGRALGFHRRDSRGDWYLYRRPSADDRRGFPKPGRCIKHNRHGVFPVGITQSCGNPSFQLSDILFVFSFSSLFFLLLLYYETTISFHSSLSLFVISYYSLIISHTTPFFLFHFRLDNSLLFYSGAVFFYYYLHMLTHTSRHFQVMLSCLFSFFPYRYVSFNTLFMPLLFYFHAILFSGCFPFTFTYHFNLCRVVPEGQR